MVFPLIFVSVVMASVAQVLLKFGMNSPAVQKVIAVGDALSIISTISLNVMVVTGLALYFLSAVVWLFVLSRIELSSAYPFAALGFVFTAILARLILGESFNLAKISGTLLIIGGVMLIARGVA